MDMSDRFFDGPILNSPYDIPAQHWELDETGQPTNHILDWRRQVSFITPIPRPKKRKGAQQALIFDEAAQRVATEGQQYELHDQQRPQCRGPLAGATRAQPVAGNAGDGAVAPTLAASSVQRNPTFLLSGPLSRAGAVGRAGAQRKADTAALPAHHRRSQMVCP